MMTSIYYFLVVFIVAYVIRVAIYLVWLYLETEKTIKHAKKFENISARNSCNVLFIGDSLTFGVGASSTERSIAGLYYSENPKCNVINKSINKITTRDFIKITNKLTKLRSHYTKVILSIGGNDVVQFRSLRDIERRIGHIVDKLNSLSENVYIFTPTKPGKSPIIIKLLIYKRVEKLRNIIRSLESTHVHHVDMWEAGDKLLANPKKYFVKDTLHLSDAGQLAWYEQLKKSMER